MGSIEPQPDRLQAFLGKLDDETPVVMINLLRYRERAAYPAGSEHAPCSGREAYQRYSETALQKIRRLEIESGDSGSAPQDERPTVR